MATAPIQKTATVTIPITSGYSQWVNVKGFALIAIETPSAWTSASITVRASSKLMPTNVDTLPYDFTGGDVYDDLGSAITLSAAASRFIRMDERLFQGAARLCFAADGQAAARDLILTLRDQRDLINTDGR